MAKIHVIIPVYNAEAYLQEAVDSVLSQPYKGIDIVLVNDGSTDKSAKLCNEIATHEDRVYVIHKENGGVASARNAGIEYVLQKGLEDDYVAFLDSDDYWFPDFMMQRNIVELSGQMDLDIVAFGSVRCDQNKKYFSCPTEYKEDISVSGNESIWLLRGPFCACLYSVRLLSRWSIRFFEGLKYCEDKIFQMQCAFFAGTTRFIPRLMHINRENVGSAMKRAQSIPAINYYLPIIDAWIKSDTFVNKWSDVTGRRLRSGCILAGIYFVDMAKDHYKQCGSRKNIEKVLKEHPYNYLMLEFQEPDVQPYQRKKRDLLVHHPLIFQLKYNVIGMLEFIAKLMLRVSPVRNWWIKRKYPLTQIPINE